MKVVIADWGTECNGDRYVMFFAESDHPNSCFYAIDTMGDPFATKYKLYDPEDFESISSQEQIAERYNETDEDDPAYNKAHDFSSIDYASLWSH